MSLELADIIRFVGTVAATYIGVKVELRWLRSDVDKAHSGLKEHDRRIRKLEVKTHGHHEA